MVDLETITLASTLGLMATAVFGGIPLALGMSAYARAYNSDKRDDFLKKELKKNDLGDVHIGEFMDNPKRKGSLLVPVESDGNRYLMQLQHRKSFWFADIFYDTRLYDPVRLIRNNLS
jgi:hypothetical protein